MPAGLSRRELFGVAAGSIAWRPGGATAARTLDLDSPEDALTAMVKMRGSLAAEDVPHWYYGTIYAVFPNEAPVPLVDFEGSEIDYYLRQPDGSYHAYGATVSFFRDRGTGKRLTEYRNPFTGVRNEVLGNSISVDAHYIYSVNGFKRSDDKRPLPSAPKLPELLEWQERGEHIWLTMRRTYPPGLPMGEHQLVRGSVAELHDPSVTKVYTTATPTYVSPWLPWMGMRERAGHLMWVGPALKLDSVEQYPRELLDFMERYYPQKLSARPDSA